MPTLSLQPDAADGQDVFIDIGVPNSNYGANATVQIGYFAASLALKSSLIKFDLSSIPLNATVITSVLTITYNANIGTQAYTVGAYQAIRAWTEGTKTGSGAPDGATWNTYDGTNNWGTAGCNNTTSDRLAVAENAHALNMTGNNSWSIPLMTITWVSTPASNKGLILRTADAWSAQGLWVGNTSDSATPANRPTLTVMYTLPATAMVRCPMWGRFH